MSPVSPVQLNLEQSRDALDFVSQIAGVGLWHWHLPSGAVHLDAATAGACGLPQVLDAEDFISKAVVPPDQERLRSAMDHALASFEPSTVTLTLVDAGSGAGRSLTAHIKVERDSAGRAVQLLIATRLATQHSEDHRSTDRDGALVERLSIATQAAGIFVWEFDWLKRAISWDENRLSQNASNRHFGQELGSDFFQWIHPEDRAIGQRALLEALKAGQKDASFRYRLKLQDGTIRHIQAYARTHADARGEPLRSLGVSWDVTREVEDAERLARRTEELRVAQRRLERASLSAQEGHWEIDWIAGRHWGSSNYYALLGYGPDEVEFDTFAKLDAIMHPDDLSSVHAAVYQHIDNHSPLYDVDLRIRMKDGGYRWFRLRGSAERDEAGRVVRMAGSIQDIQKQKSAEEALKEANARFDRAVRGTQDGFWEADARKDQLWLSPRAHELLGFEVGELGDHFTVLRERVHPEDLGAADQAQRICLEQSSPIDIEMRLRRKDGEYRWFRVRATPERDTADGVSYRAAGAIQDVTEAHAARQALIEASAAAQAANRSKSAFLANMSHEIRTPMNGIIGMTSLLLDTTLDRAQRDYAETIRTSADSLLTIINDILDFSKIEAGKLDIESIPMALHDSVEDIGTALAFQAAAKDVELIINVHPQVPQRVLGDPQRIRQCLINLIGNAIKFTVAGEIVVDVAVAGSDGDVPNVHFSVRDTGIGMSKESVKALFQPFMQADVSTTRKFGGTGLGLSIVRRLVELMGGQLGVESELAKGSTFWFVLPMQEVAAEAPEQSVVLRTGQRLLIVDDNETNRRVLATHLTHLGYSVTLASSGPEALTLMRLAVQKSRPFDLVLSDFQMPVMDGAALGEAINADPQLALSRIVLLTSVTHHGDRERFASLGFAGYLTKPIRMRDLKACLSRVLERKANEWHLRSYPMVTAGSMSAVPRTKPYSGKVLLVEDNVVNQKVGRKFLERLGCEVRIAETGAQGVDAWREEEFELVLMDIQMPVMDGYTAARQIRDLEGAQRRTPIIALTADAMTGQLERCLQAGMDGLLTKPLDPENLQEVLERFGLAQDESVLPDSAVEQFLKQPPVRESIDVQALHALVDGDPAFARALVTEYAENSRKILTSLRELLAAGNRAGMVSKAHELKGASANLRAQTLASVCEKMEKEAAEASAEKLSRDIDELTAHVERVNAALARFLAKELAA